MADAVAVAEEIRWRGLVREGVDELLGRALRMQETIRRYAEEVY